MEHKMISIADQVFEELERDILSGLYERDEVLTEMKLSEQLHVSRTPIREALRRLEQEHIIEPTSKGMKVVGITRDDISDICEIRLRLEGLAARWAAERADEAGIRLPEQLQSQPHTYRGCSTATADERRAVRLCSGGNCLLQDCKSA